MIFDVGFIMVHILMKGREILKDMSVLWIKPKETGLNVVTIWDCNAN